MFIFNPKTNVIERRESVYPLQDVDKPNLYDNLYSYDEVPKIESRILLSRSHIFINSFTDWEDLKGS